MPNAQLLHIFKSLSNKDRAALCELADCPFFNKKTAVAQLCRYLAAQVPRAEPGCLDKAKLHEAAFPGQPYDDARLRLAMSGLLKLTERYLAICEMEKSEAVQALYLLPALRHRGLEKRFEKKQKELQAKLESDNLQDAHAHRLHYMLASEELEGRSSKQRSSLLELHPLHNHLTAYYLSEMLRHACSALTHQAISAQVYDMGLLQQVLLLAEQFGLEAYPAIAIYYHACKALQAPEDRQFFDRWKQCLYASAELFSNAELRGIYLLGINYCIRRMNQGGQEFIREAFGLYRAALAKGLLAEKGYLTAFTFKNIIRIGTALEEHEWTQDFFEQYQAMLPPRERAGAVYYNAAFLHFRRQEYGQAMPLLQQLAFEDTLNSLDARRMLLRSYYELGEMDALDSLLHSFATYLHRQKDLGYHKTLYLNLLRFLRQLLDLPPGDRQQLQRLEGLVAKTDQVAEKEWLLSKIREKR